MPRHKAHILSNKFPLNMPPAVTRIQSNRATFYFNITSWIRCNYVTLSSQYGPKSDLQKIRVVLKAKLGLGVPNKKVDRIAFFYSALCLKKKTKKKQVQQSHYSFATDNFNILSKEVELHITSLTAVFLVAAVRAVF